MSSDHFSRRGLVFGSLLLMHAGGIFWLMQNGSYPERDQRLETPGISMVTFNIADIPKPKASTGQGTARRTPVSADSQQGDVRVWTPEPPKVIDTPPPPQMPAGKPLPIVAIPKSAINRARSPEMAGLVAIETGPSISEIAAELGELAREQPNLVVGLKISATGRVASCEEGSGSAVMENQGQACTLAGKLLYRPALDANGVQTAGTVRESIETMIEDLLLLVDKDG